jgi:translation initiation factor 2-alpha kinase 4
LRLDGWIEQGRGGFGSVVKARNKIDNRIYAVKKIRLKTQQSDTKIFREVNALSRLSHRFIVRYYTTWVETSESNAVSGAGDGVAGGSGGLLSAGAGSNDSSSDGEGNYRSPSLRSRGLRIPGFRSSSSSSSKVRDSGEGDDEGGEEEEEEASRNSASTVSERHLPTNGGGFSLSEFDDFDDFDFHRHHHHHRLRLGDDDDSVATTTTTEMSGSRGSFPSIHFDKSTTGGDSSTEEEETDEGISSGSGSGSPQSDGIQFGVVRKGHGVAPARGTATTVGPGGVGQRRPRTGTVVGQDHRIGGAGKAIHPVTPGTGVGGRTEGTPYALASAVPNVTRTLYIQMEFVERQTLREVSFCRCFLFPVDELIAFLLEN